MKIDHDNIANEASVSPQAVTPRRRMRRPSFERHAKTHKAVIRSEEWYGDEGPDLGAQFTAARTESRQQETIKILRKAEKRARRAGDKFIAREYGDLRFKLDHCEPRRRCGSLACLLCARAFQKAKVDAETRLHQLLRQQSKKAKVFVSASIIPLNRKYRPAELNNLDIVKFNRWVKDILATAGFKRIIFGSADISWMSGYFQPHWHLSMFSSNPTQLQRRLKPLFPGDSKHDRTVVVTRIDSDYLRYQAKIIKVPELLRRARRQLPELLLLFDRTEPFDTHVLSNVRLSAPGGRPTLRPISR